MDKVAPNSNKEFVNLNASPVKDSDRLKFALFLAISLHLLVMLGVRFVLPESENTQIPLSLDVTLAQRESLKAPEQADFIGQKNQQGAGDAELAERPTTELENFKNTEGQTSVPTLELVPEQHQSNQQLQLVTSSDSTINTPQPDDQENEQNTPDQIDKPTEITPPPQTLQQHNVEQDIAKQLKTKGVKKRQISAAIIESAADAAYLEVWRKKIERVGNLHYPEQAKQQGIFGKLMLKVAIAKDGNLVDVKILQSSGKKILDQAAIDIVRLAAPFDELPVSMRHNTDVLEIVRLWQFKPDNSLNTR
ncbi:MAG: energy transducer TonB [Kangiellaceae bacterium]|nr:energy transducer TonB [Kangiellaceae bacterium]